MNMKKTMIAIASCLILAGVAFAARPARNVSANKPPNLAAARKARDLLDQAGTELKEAAEAANAAK